MSFEETSGHSTLARLARRELLLLLYAFVSAGLSCALLGWLLWRFVPASALLLVGHELPPAARVTLRASTEFVRSLPFLVVIAAVAGPLLVRSSRLRALALGLLLVAGPVALVASFAAAYALQQAIRELAAYVPGNQPDVQLFRAAERLSLACLDGSPLACATLGAMHTTGEGMVRPNPEYGRGLLRQACEAGSRCGCAELERLPSSGMIRAPVASGGGGTD